MRAFLGLRSTAWIAVGSLFVSSAAYAETPSATALAQAQTLFEEAIGLIAAKRYPLACPKLEKVTELVPTGIGGHEALAECYKVLKRYGSAWEQYTIAKTLSQKAVESKRAAQNAAKAKALEPKVAKITIVVDKALRDLGDLTILRDGELQDPALWNTPLPVDTGKHTIEAKAAGRESWSTELTVLADGVSLTVEVPIKRMPLLPVAKVAPAGAVFVPAADPSTPRVWQRPVGYATMGLGVASLLTSAIFSAIAVQKRDASMADGHCTGGNLCDAVGMPLRDQAMTYANGATATVVAGGVLAAGGLLLVLTAPRKKSEEGESKKPAVSWGVSISPTGGAMVGAW